MNKHQRRTEETRAKLLASARRIFVRDGFEATRIEDIATDSGHTRGAFYAHFESKEDLFLALLQQEASANLERLQARLEAAGSAEDRLSVLRAHFLSKATDNHWAMLVLEFKLFALRHPKDRGRLAEAYERVRESLKTNLVRELVAPVVQVCDLKDEAVARAVCEAVIGGLALEHAYNPKNLNNDNARLVMGRIFDMLFSPQAQALRQRG